MEHAGRDLLAGDRRADLGLTGEILAQIYAMAGALRVVSFGGALLLKQPGTEE